MSFSFTSSSGGHGSGTGSGRSGTGVRDMTQGPILKQILIFAIPLMFGNLFQMLYNTVDSIVVGNFVSKQALAAVGSTNMIINLLVFFFNGFSIGAGVIIGQRFGAKKTDELHTAIETTMLMTFIFCVLFTIIGVSYVNPMLRFMSTPEDVIPDAALYLRIYFSGISGLLIYNIGSGILRAVGNTTLPLLFLVLTSLMNIVLDLFFVVGLHMGIEGVAYATILSQFVSAGLTLMLLTGTKEIYRLSWRDLSIDRETAKQIFTVALPTGIQAVITSFSNIFVQAYINYFGSSCMAGWSCYNKLDQIMMLVIQSVAMAVTTFVSQNIGAKKEDRARQGTMSALGLILTVNAVIAALLVFFSRQAVSLFTKDESVISYGQLFITTNTFFILFNAANHALAGSMRGRGDSRGPMMAMLAAFVVFRQIYLFVLTRFISNTPRPVGFSYPVGWMLCSCIMFTYYFRKYGGTKKPV